MQSIGFKGIFNARWLTPEEVALKFVPIQQFQRLVHSTHAVLLGPRGSGKTTLLKMLTREAIKIWKLKRESEFNSNPFEYPEFETLYIPSDVRWSYEIRHLEQESFIDQTTVNRTQRAMVTSGILTSFTYAMEKLLKPSDELEHRLCSALLDHWGLKNTLPLFTDVRESLSNLVIRMRAALNLRNAELLNKVLADVSLIFFAHILDSAISSCNIASDLIQEKLKFSKWALCFDELEIAPEWLRTEIFESLRSTDQNFFLKITYSPLLPSGLKSAPERDDDYIPIRLWHSHINDARQFCEDLAANFLETTFPQSEVTPDSFFSQSLLAREEPFDEDHYKRGSIIYREMRSLAQHDTSFSKMLEAHGVEPQDPYPTSKQLRNTLFRKIKPIVVLRRNFIRDKKLRSRKLVVVYSGKQSIYAMSEANPRWLLSLLTNLHDRWRVNPTFGRNKSPKINYREQARTLNSAARKFQDYLSATAFLDTKYNKSEQPSLLDFLKKIGNALQNEFLGDEFPLDPIGSFLVEENPTEELVQAITKAVEIGALVYIGKSDESIPKHIEGSRFRLTFMLAPIYRLPFRNYRATSLQHLLRKAANGSPQTGLFDSH